MNNDAKSKIAELEKELYKKDFAPRKVSDILHPQKIEVGSGWEQNEGTKVSSVPAGGSHKIMKIFFLLSLLFFLIAAGIFGFVRFRGGNVISGDNIIIGVVAPVGVKGGEQFETKFTITNKNAVSVDSVNLLIEYPPGFYATAGQSELPREVRDIGVLAPGESKSESVHALLYGEENSEREVRVVLEYRMAGSNATLKKASTYKVKVVASPLDMKLQVLKEASSGQEMNLVINVDSNSLTGLNDLLLNIAYPLGFTFKSAVPAPTYGNAGWSIGTLPPQGKQTIKISGLIEGEEGENKVFQVALGAQSKKDERAVGVVYTAVTEGVTITKPFFGLDFVINGARAVDYILQQGRPVRADLFWVNNNDTAITDAVIEVKLKGEMLNRYSIYASNSGFYRSIDDTIVWDKSRNPDLALVESGARGSMSFSFSQIPLLVESGKIFKNSQIVLEAKVRARRNSDANVPEEVSTITTRRLKVETDLRLSTYATFHSGPFKNTGVVPPKADRETTYTVTWVIRNASNNVSNLSVRATLPIYVKWLDLIIPEGEDITYSEGASEVVWNVDRIPSGGSREVSFQISFIPSLSQLGTAPSLTSESILVGTDDFTKTELRDRKSAVTINLASDPQFSQNEGVVVR